MVISKNKGLIYSNYILESLGNRFSDTKDLHIHVETFYNCRELGYVFKIYETKEYKKDMCIWIYAQRNSDDPTVSWDYISIPKESANMFDDETYRKRTRTYETIHLANIKVNELIEDYFKEVI